jgi:hypothetical protein
MTTADPASTRQWHYRFSRPGGAELEHQELPGDDAAASRARELSASENTPVIVHRLHQLVDDWEFIAEVDDRH